MGRRSREFSQYGKTERIVRYETLLASSVGPGDHFRRLCAAGAEEVWVWYDAHPAEVQPVGVETGLERYVLMAFSAGVEAARHVEQVELFIGELERLAQADG